MSKVIEVIDEIAKKCCKELLPDEVNVQAVENGSEHFGELVTVIGYSGEEVKGALGLMGPGHAIASLHPVPDIAKNPTEHMLYDWLGELANQLLGRIKGELLRYGQSVWIASPVVLRGVSIRVASQPEKGIQQYTFSGVFGNLNVWLDFQYPTGLELKLLPEEELDHPTAGEILFF